MKKINRRKKTGDDLREEYPEELIREGVRGMYAQPMEAGYKISVISPHKKLAVEVEREVGGRWLAEVIGLAGVMAYGKTRSQAIARAQALALRVIADRLEHGEDVPDLDNVFSVVA